MKENEGYTIKKLSPIITVIEAYTTEARNKNIFHVLTDILFRCL